MTKWVYMEDGTAVRLTDYRRDADLQARPATHFRGVFDETTQTWEVGKPTDEAKPAPKRGAQEDDGA